ncbi:tRNA (N(6)-L-threonylcarbamoyladenosine(37)-C(2))-methylthiotransferase MtaB [Sphingomonas sp. SM33]|uniref:tRNA (N(6)-L-threonylcarbamoyladenosine(37)-C(2))-methylthiotransferase MtaB n=1 Tax=Sphingomonas telluris TaxID=2907998 RepID=A0ABS9VKP4_9SPHN|nr:tRNA (N(6)-L-threonylcarbamoyladenosine(37)-C(2))-methylthiotransferase MtaB [Sphingomonas telluris]MCH8615546.1 tRNA (N(6)-L-threonylcarbamoyladenosine(37)-C(2))-methylthiotransferase MtaB [Sphingomonas telluris]
MSVETITLGCRLNFAESETIKRLAKADEDWVVVNSCAVTNEAVRQTRQAIRQSRRQRPEARILVTGCAAELDRGSFANMPEVDRVVGNDNKIGSLAMLAAKTSQVVPAGFLGHVRSFVAVQTGCDHRCTFCSIWRARGPSRSLSFEAIRDAVQRELDRGAKEIVLTGVDITSYHYDALGLGELCQRLIATVPDLGRLRLSSLDSIEIDEPLFELIAGEPRLMPHFHLSLQAGDDMILKRMKRRHSRSDAVRMVERIKSARADATVGADLIAGFPTETEEMALNSLKLLDDCDVIAAHIFPFSPRPNTPAERMPQLAREVVKVRAARLRQAASERRTRWLRGLVGSSQRVLMENNAKGHSDGFAPVRIEQSSRGDAGVARMTGLEGDHLTAVWA